MTATEGTVRKSDCPMSGFWEGYWYQHQKSRLDGWRTGLMITGAIAACLFKSEGAKGNL